ncbi:MAG: DNA adenine methylase [Candidatus Synechococcus spongiarum 142]|uniref:Site-specific DNA-methyltransferase (adenine-specific) n=1 Tax=Candidatus Synechococcus spongiarum 142 TaxID=1608213 RepID=A0A6N3X987_9SYNE|nr:MAG: DNA adenine methylase [Candidatus Synechococcus spongiarum 142]
MQGIKTKAVPFIRQHVNWDGNGRWIEPFVGSGSVVFNINPDRALLGDINPHLIQFYRSIQEGTVTGDTVHTFLEREGAILRQIGQEYYYQVRDRFNELHDPHDFLFLNRSCFNGLMRFNRRGGFNTPFCKKSDRFRPAYMTRISNQVRWVAEKMKDRSWVFECIDWTELLSQVKHSDIVYADPPYAGRFTDYYNSWNENDANSFEAALKNLPCPFLYSMWSENKYRRNDRLHRSFEIYEIKTFSHFYHLGSTENLRNGMTEALVIG